MKFLLNVYDTRSASASDDEMAAITEFNEGIRDSGSLVLAAGLAFPGESRVFRGVTGDELDASIVAPVPSGTEYFISGLWIISATDRDAAEQLARDAARACGRHVELRPFLE